MKPLKILGLSFIAYWLVGYVTPAGSQFLWECIEVFLMLAMYYGLFRVCRSIYLGLVRR